MTILLEPRKWLATVEKCSVTQKYSHFFENSENMVHFFDRKMCDSIHFSDLGLKIVHFDQLALLNL